MTEPDPLTVPDLPTVPDRLTPASPAPDLLLRSARLVDVDAGVSTGPTDVRLSDGRVAAVAGPGGAVDRRPGDEVVDLDGRWLMPGLWDAHTHMSQWALTRRRLDVAGAGSAAEVAAMVVARLREEPPPVGLALVGTGFRDGLWPEPPTATVLDGALAEAGLPPTPVVVVCGDLHSAWLSTPAMESLGVDPRCDGVVREEDWFPLMATVDSAPDDVTDRWVAEAAAGAAARGVVGVVDLELADNVAAWRRRTAAGMTGLRVVAGVWPQHLDRAVARGLATGDVVPGTAGLVTMGPLKVISDGALNTRTAYCHDPYPGVVGRHAHGVLNVGPAELAALMARAARHGIHSAIHAIGDRANGLALDAFAASGARGSVEHAQLLCDEDVDRFAALGVVASVQPEHAMDDRDVAERHWAGRTGRAFPLRRLHAAGVRLVLGSDAPVAPLDPWYAISAAVERARDGREPWHPDEALPVEVALAASVRSRIAVGEPADLVVLDADPVAARGESLRRMPVAGTLLAGGWTHRAL